MTFSKQIFTLCILLGFLIQSPFAQSNINLDQYTQCGDLVNVEGITVNLSGITHNDSNNKLYAVTNNPTRMYRLNDGGQVEVTYVLNEFLDTEGIEFVGNNTVAIVEEGRRRIVYVQIPQGTADIYTINYPGEDNYIQLDFVLSDANKGLEGIAYDITTNTMYVCKEKNPTSIYSIPNPESELGRTVIPTVAFGTVPGIADMAGLDYRAGSLFLLSDDSDRLVEINLTTNQITSSLNALEHGQAEGITFNSQNDLIIVGESNEFATYRNSTVGCNPSLPDLHVTCGPLFVNGSEVVISDVRVYNYGEADAASSYVGYYVSTDTDITRADVFVGNDYVKPLSRTNVSVENFSFDSATLGLDPGTYYVGAIADYLSVVDESNETNNECYHSIQEVNIGIDSDLIVECGSISVSGLQINLSGIKTTNIGEGKTGVTYTGIFLSTDQTYDDNDILIANEYIWALGAGNEKIDQLSSDLSGRNLPNGEYYVLIVADYMNIESESNEVNNSCIHNSPKITIGTSQNAADIVMDCGDVTLENNIITFSNVLVTNIGSATASSYGRVAYYISSTQSIPGNPSYLIGTDYFPQLAPGAISTEQVTVNLDNFSYLAAGSYYIGAKADYSGRIQESDEGNNLCFSDLIVTISNAAKSAESRSSSLDERLENKSSKSISIMPNPVRSNSSFQLDLIGMDRSLVTINVFSTTGKLIANYPSYGSSKVDIPTANMLPGIYIVQVSGLDFIKTRKIIIQ